MSVLIVVVLTYTDKENELIQTEVDGSDINYWVDSGLEPVTFRKAQSQCQRFRSTDDL